MTKRVLMLIALALLASTVMMAQTPESAAAAGSKQWLWISAGFSMAIASSLCGLAQGKAIASAVEGMARNPGAAKSIQLAMLIGLAFIESLSLYTLLVVFVFMK